jgi:triphosphatase
MAEQADHIEVEWQFDARDTRTVAHWLEGVSVPGFTVTPKGTKHLVDRYIDTPDWAVYRAGFTARIREKGGAAELTMKSMASATEGIRSRRELTQPLPEASLEAISAAGEAGAALLALAGRRPLRFLFTLETARQAYTLADDDSPFGEIALDDTHVPGEGGEGARLVRVEVEVDGAAVERAKPFVERLVGACRLGPAAASKYQAALQATGLRPPLPPALGPTAIAPGMSIGEVAYAVMRKHFGVFLANEGGTRLGLDIEALHDMRVAARRLRAAMAAFRAYLPPRFERLRLELGWIAAALGEVRDLDVQLEQLEEWKAGLAEREAHSLDALEGLLRERRERARRRMLAALDSKRYERLVLRFAATLRRGPPRRHLPGREPILATAPGLLERRYRRLRKVGDRIRPGSPPAAYHALRIEGKKLRYLLEFVGPIYGEPAVEFSRRLTSLQDLLGEHQDADVAVELLHDLAARNRRLGPSTLLTMGMLAERYRAHAQDLRARFPAVYRKLGGREWARLRRVLDRQRSAPVPDATRRVLYSARAKPQAWPLAALPETTPPESS